MARRILNFRELFEMFAKAGEPHKIGPILDAFLARRHFHNAGGAYRRELKRLDAIGAIDYLGGGLYTASPLLTPTFRWLEISARQAAVR